MCWTAPQRSACVASTRHASTASFQRAHVCSRHLSQPAIAWLAETGTPRCGMERPGRAKKKKKKNGPRAPPPRAPLDPPPPVACALAKLFSYKINTNHTHTRPPSALTLSARRVLKLRSVLDAHVVLLRVAVFQFRFTIIIIPTHTHTPALGQTQSHCWSRTTLRTWHF